LIFFDRPDNAPQNNAEQRRTTQNNAEQRRTTQNNIVACDTDTFAVRDFVRTGRVLKVVAYALILLFSATC